MLVLNNAIIVVPFVWGTYVLESLSGFTANLDLTAFVADLWTVHSSECQRI
jgi:hypothetical protein